MAQYAEINWCGFLRLRNDETHLIEAAKCRTCNKIIQSISEKTFTDHRNICLKKQIGEKNEIVESMDVEGSSSQHDEIQDKFRELKRILDEDLIKFFITTNIPFKAVENKYFLKFIHRLCNSRIDYKPPSSQVLSSNVMPSLYKEIMKKKKSMLKDTNSVLLADLWHDKFENRNYLVFSLRNINAAQTFLTIYNILFHEETAESLAMKMNASIKLAKKIYATNVFAVVTENGSKFFESGELARTLDSEPIFQSTCFVDFGNSLLNNYLKNNLVMNLKDIINTFSDPKLESLVLSRGGSPINKYDETRFCSFQDSCKNIVKNFSILQELCIEENLSIPDTVFDNLLDDNFEKSLTELIDSLNPISEFIDACKNQHCNIADAVEYWLSLTLPSNISKDIANLKMENILLPVQLAANLMHHKYQGQKLNKAQKKIATQFLSNYLDFEAQEQLEIYSSSFDYDYYKANCKDPIAYWKLIGLTLPNLSAFVSNLMLIPASTALIEELFSNWTYIHNSYKNRLEVEQSSRLLDVYYELCLQNADNNSNQQ